MKEFTPKSINIKGATGDAQILADVLRKDLRPRFFLLDIGCGDGLVAISVAARRTDVDILGVDIDTISCAAARDNIKRVQITDRVGIICADVFKTKLPTSDAVCCNPPLLPDERGFFAEEQTTQYLFWKALIEKISTEEIAQLVYLHLFDFHGINHRSGRLPSLQEVAKTTGFSVATMYRGVRKIGENSRIRRNLTQLVDYFPEGTLLVDDSEVPIYKFSSIYTNTIDNLYTYQSIVRLSR